MSGARIVHLRDSALNVSDFEVWRPRNFTHAEGAPYGCAELSTRAQFYFLRLHCAGQTELVLCSRFSMGADKTDLKTFEASRLQ
jgi:hypothetical protein